ncbi:fimbrial protein [Pseudomonas boanensis]|uniref:fimbrial protein n=1 Tax=Metapseudomonas boanensis TaxID=2822138 RepID=UPI0035D432BD
MNITSKTLPAVALFLSYLTSNVAQANLPPRCGNEPVQVPLELRFDGPTDIKVTNDTTNGTVLYEETITAGQVDFRCDLIGHSIGVNDKPSSPSHPVQGGDTRFPLLGNSAISWEIVAPGNFSVSGPLSRPYGQVNLPANQQYRLGPGKFTLRLVKTGSITNGMKIPAAQIGLINGGSGYGNTLGILANIYISRESDPAQLATCKTAPIIPVEMGGHQPSSFLNTAGLSRPTHFSIKLTECDAGIANIKYKLRANTTVLDKNAGLVSLNAASTAKGVGLKLMDQQGNAIVLDQDYNVEGYTLDDKTGEVPLSAAYARLTAYTPEPGTANAEVTFIMTYE